MRRAARLPLRPCARKISGILFDTINKPPYRAKESPMKRKQWLIAVISLLMTGLVAGCHTVEGFGKDVERGGEKIQGAAK